MAHALYEDDNGNHFREVMRDIPVDDMRDHAWRMLMGGAKEVTIKPEPCDEFGPATNGKEPINQGDTRDWERMQWERRRKKSATS